MTIADRSHELAELRYFCSVPACRRSTPFDALPAHHTAWLCARHWSLIPAPWKRVKARHEREHRRFVFYPRAAAYRRLCARIWREAGA